MRLDIFITDRVGIAHEILAVLAHRRLNVVAMEVEPPHIYIDVPELAATALADLRADLTGIAGVHDTRVVDLLPGARRRLHLDTLLAALADPVLAVDARGAIVVANPAAAAVAGMAEVALIGMSLGELFGDPALHEELVRCGFRAPMREVMLHGAPFLLDVTPVRETAADAAGAVAGGVVLLQAPSRIGERLHALQHFEAGGFERILGDSPPMRALKARAVRVAAVDAPLLILGETGTGKELIAHACHQASGRRAAPFLALNCAALPESLAESELFGYAPGAFSGAQRSGKPGLLELADRGTVFLDEVGELSPYLQAKLLRFLNDGSFRRVGGSREQKVDVRILSATHRDLERMVAERSFREDLYYRLNVLSLQVPPLRERAEDILLLARHFIERACAQVQRPPCRLSAAAGAALLAYPWPGNVRQLENVIFRAVTMSDKSLLDVADFDLAGAVAQGGDGPHAGSWSETMEAFERGLLERLYPLYPSSRKLAARLKTSHSMIAAKLRKYHLCRQR
ncbi:MAG TPA: sigma 54-interacting transcriptional regulator [Candidatus Competibacteraceae bacterium]|nr:sigma 54-interacting transcriptional regulator [Candidatus Competibacteraceae bacterium]